MADLVREAFETWGKSKYLYLEPANERQTKQGRSYYTEQSENMWLAFQAGATLATPSPSPVSAPSPAGGVREAAADAGATLEWQEVRRDLWKRDGASIRKKFGRTGMAWRIEFDDGGTFKASSLEEAKSYADDRLSALASSTPNQPSTASVDQLDAGEVDYFLACVEAHADKFPVPQSMRRMAGHIRAALSSPATPEPVSAPATGGEEARLMRGTLQVIARYSSDSDARLRAGRVLANCAALSSPAPGHGEGGL